MRFGKMTRYTGGLFAMMNLFARGVELVDKGTRVVKGLRGKPPAPQPAAFGDPAGQYADEAPRRIAGDPGPASYPEPDRCRG